MCKESYYDESSQLQIETWCGDIIDRSKGVCELDDQSKAKHYVYVRSLKTVDREINVKGLIERNKAKFEGDPSTVKSETEWSCMRKLYKNGKLREVYIEDALVTKKAKGDEVIKVEVEYKHNWNTKILERADLDKLIFQIHII